MRLIKLMVLAGIIMNASVGYAQYGAPINAGFDVGAGATDNSFAPSVLYYEAIGIPRANWLQFSLGIRAWGYYANRTNLYTKTANPQDYMEYRTVAANGLSFVVGANIKFWRIDLGVNTDLAGLAFGTQRHGFYEKTTTINPGVGQQNYNQWLATSPVILNVLPLAFKNNNGQSELYARIFVAKRLGIKLGYVYGQLAYLTKKSDGKKVLLDNRQRRFSDNYGVPYVALTFHIAN
ncbi:hypothetical protein [Dyadobacter sp. CY323]|uniref:hypothetical protein n=1 Tax=Dyadobacter sp. CY323 TaxID=2907302 RepID=UPI001F48C043|nr:hypothetical protein [Dyadobacter sp. CY323]MCE6988807.1 hypothetical protein [Dyadobacter sp. CY323]